jgi:hypothetical protein
MDAHFGGCFACVRSEKNTPADTGKKSRLTLAKQA